MTLCCLDCVLLSQTRGYTQHNSVSFTRETEVLVLHNPAEANSDVKTFFLSVE